MTLEVLGAAETLCEHGAGLKDVDIAVAFEIGDVEREDAVDRVDAHDGNQAGVIDLDALTRWS